jgi:hypothetical protein
MKLLPLILAGTAVLALTACGGSKEAEAEAKAEAKKEVSISIADADGDTATADTVTIDGDSDSGNFEVKLPGGVEAKVKVPGEMLGKSDFDIDGVGLYPGAKVGAVNVKAQAGKDKGQGSATVKIGFSAPADAAAVADWYQQQFEAKKVAVTRSGETLTGKTRDGDDFTLALAPAGSGAAKGELTIIDGPDAG